VLTLLYVPLIIRVASSVLVTSCWTCLLSAILIMQLQSYYCSHYGNRPPFSSHRLLTTGILRKLSFFLRDESIEPTPNPQLGGPGYLSLTGTSFKTSPSWMALLAALLPPSKFSSSLSPSKTGLPQGWGIIDGATNVT